jgi:hypothetical protein
MAAAIDIEVTLSEEIASFLAKPRCVDIALPEPATVKLDLPTGGTLKGVNFDPNVIPTECSLNLSLLLQLGPILANLECFIRVLKLIKPLIDVVKGLPFPPVEAIVKFGEAAAEVTECIVKLTTPLGMIPFVKDILLLIIRMLKCMVSALKSIIGVMEKLSLDMIAAAGNPTQEALIQCAQDNAQRAATAQLQAVEPVMIILEIAAPIFEVAQVGPIEIPTLASAEDMEGIKSFIESIEGFIETLELIVEALP